MATYTYTCANKHSFDVEAKNQFLSSLACPVCNSKILLRKRKNINVAFRGSGFYSTDSKKEK